MKIDKRTYQVHILLNEEEKKLFDEKTQGYRKIAAMIRDAVAQFDDRGAKQKINTLNKLSNLIKSFNIELSRQGGNLNQAVARANELIYAGELNQKYFEDVLMPEIKKTQRLIRTVKRQQSDLFKQVAE